MVKITRQDEIYLVAVNRKRMELTSSDYHALHQALFQFDKNDSAGDLVALEIDDKGLITVTRPLNPVAADK